ncbi:VHL beta domain-containing protein [Pseudoduganella namucuonensis]|uniref:VHL beta domain-containing protein n=1 Tax=Pseudoduganella namucuonensis TaxID=1035707 RepID=UPI000B86E190|nr:hypothetical protein [Pseudoduganella namucuonensis]
MFANLCKFGPGLLAAIFLTGCATAVVPQRTDANQNGTVKSISSETTAQITFVNKSGQDVKIYWLDFSGRRVLYMILEADKSYSQQTYLTHPWLVTDGRDNVWNIFFADAQPRVAYIVAPSAKKT